MQDLGLLDITRSYNYLYFSKLLHLKVFILGHWDQSHLLVFILRHFFFLV